MSANVYRFQVGEIACTVFCDSTSTMSQTEVAELFPVDGERMAALYRAPLNFAINILMLETAGKRVLIDAGMGQLDPADLGALVDTMAAENITPDSIDTVIISHYHLDHLGGLIDGQGQAVFSRARLVVPAAEHQHWMSDESLATMQAQRAKILRSVFAAYADRLVLHDGADEIEAGIRYLPSVGHTPGHQAIDIRSSGERLVHMVDTFHVPLQLNAPDAVIQWDMQPQNGIAARQAMLARAEAEKLHVMAYHFSFPGVGTIRAIDEGLAWQGD